MRILERGRAFVEGLGELDRRDRWGGGAVHTVAVARPSATVTTSVTLTRLRVGSECAYSGIFAAVAGIATQRGLSGYQSGVVTAEK